MKLVPGFMLVVARTVRQHGCSHFCQFHDGADRLDLCQPAYGDSDDSGSRRRGRETLFVVSPLVQRGALVVRRAGAGLVRFGTGMPILFRLDLNSLCAWSPWKRSKVDEDKKSSIRRATTLAPNK